MSGGGNNDLDLCLPPEICSEILTRVQIKSILRFRSVCKSWHSLISCPNNFKPKTLADRVLFNRLEGRQGGVWSLTSRDMSFSESRDHRGDLPGRVRGQRLDTIGSNSCNGLICLLDDTDRDLDKEEVIYSFFIYNPAIRKIVELPSLTAKLYTIGSNTHSYYGFGFDSKANDYKVILISREFCGPDEIESHEGFMFDLRNGVWRKFTPIFPNYEVTNPILPSYGRFTMCCPDFYVNDAIHWYGSCYGDVVYILAFNLSDETFRVIPMPAEIKNRGSSRIVASGGLVCALGSGDMNDPYRSVWVMKEYGVAESWTKVVAIDMPPQFWQAGFYLSFRGPEVSQVLLYYLPVEENVEGVEYVQLFMHSIESGESKCLLSMTDKSIFDLVFYKESLVLM